MPIIEKVCPLCNKKFYRAQWQAKKQTYCSQSCARKVSSRNYYKSRHVKRICQHCGIQFDTTKSSPKRFCSRLCVNKYASQKRWGSTPHHVVEIVCAGCGVKFYTSPSVERKKLYCSKACLIISQIQFTYIPCKRCSKAIKTIKSKRRVYCSNDCFRLDFIDFSKTQKLVLDKILTVSQSSKYEFEYRPDWLRSDKNWTLYTDLMLHDLNLAIEYNGKYHYEAVDHLYRGKDSLDKIQQRDQLKYKLIKEHGIHLLVWKYDEPRDNDYISHRIAQALNT